jgi:hypothetical protein
MPMRSSLGIERSGDLSSGCFAVSQVGRDLALSHKKEKCGRGKPRVVPCATPIKYLSVQWLTRLVGNVDDAFVVDVGGRLSVMGVVQA